MNPTHTSAPISFARARQAGVTVGTLRGRAYVQHSRGLYVPSHLDFHHPATRIAVARLVVPAGGAVAGLAAAWIHGVLVHPFPTTVEIAVPPGSQKRNRLGFRFHVAQLGRADTQTLNGLPVTTPLRTALDVARTMPFESAVVQLDAMAHARMITPTQLALYAESHAGMRGIARARLALAAVEPATESPMETRLRLVLLAAGLPAPRVQYELRNGEGMFVARLDLAYPAERLAVEYDGSHHRDRATFDKDLARQNLLFEHGWTLLRYTSSVVYRQCEALAAQVQMTLADCRGRATST